MKIRESESPTPVPNSPPEWQAIRDKVSRKAILSLSGDQDDTYTKYIRPNWPDIRSLTTGEGGVGLGYGAIVFASAENAPYYSAGWTSANISNRGALGAHYRVWGDGKQMVKDDVFDYFGFSGYSADQLRGMGYVVWLPPRPKGEFLGEGDSFTFLNLIANGLDAYRTETPGGWAGHVPVNPEAKRGMEHRVEETDTTSFEDFMKRLEQADTDHPSTRPPSPRPNFTPAAQNGFAARLLWSVTPSFSGANHEPTVMVHNEVLYVRPGELVRLKSNCPVSDPDKDSVSVCWWRWKDMDTFPGEVSIQDSTSLAAYLQVPTDAMQGQTIQLVLEATDDGHPALTSYKRVVVSVIH